jgi:methanogenic corrinoid protein MtbC1
MSIGRVRSRFGWWVGWGLDSLAGAANEARSWSEPAIIADLLRGVGFEVLDMGANTPAASFAETAKEANRLVAIAIALTTPGGGAAVRAAVKSIRQADLGVPILVGGAAVHDRAQALRLGADEWTGLDGRSALAAIERIARPGSRS